MGYGHLIATYATHTTCGTTAIFIGRESLLGNLKFALTIGEIVGQQLGHRDLDFRILGQRHTDRIAHTISQQRTDTNGTFVLVLTVKHSPLGNRYIATRVDVNVLAQDDTTAAVSGLSMGDYVITTSSKPLEAGMQVNMVEN